MNDQMDPNGQSSEITGPTAQSSKVQLRIDDSQATTHYATVARVTSSAEELVIDFSEGMRPTEKANVSVMKIGARIILNPWAAKRLAISLGQTVHRYESVYGELEIDPRKRAKGQNGGTRPNVASGGAAGGKGSPKN
jgi:hypothetical protein